MPIGLFLIAFFYVPLVSVFLVAINALSSYFTSIFSNSLIWNILSFSFYQSFISLVICLLIGIPTGYVLARGSPYFKKILSVGIFLPFIIPPLAILSGLTSIYGEAGIFQQFFGFSPFSLFGSVQGIIFAHVIYNISIVSRIAETSFKTIPNDLLDISDTLGASEIQKWKRIIAPHILPAVVSASILTFLLCFNSFATVLLLGEAKYQTLEVYIYSLTQVRLNFEKASLVAIFQFLINFVLILLYLKYSRKETTTVQNYKESISVSKRRRILSTAWLIIIIAFTWQAIIFIFIHFINLLSVASDSQINAVSDFTGYNSLLGTSTFRVILNTIGFSVLTGIFAVSFSIALTLYFISSRGSNQKLLGLITLLPLAISSITIAFGFILFYGVFSNFSSLVWIFIFCSHLISALPFLGRIIQNSWNEVPVDLLEVSGTLGASSLKTFKDVVFPVVKFSLIVIVLFAISISIGEFGSTYFLARGEWITMSVAIGKLFSTRTPLLPTFFALLLILSATAIFFFVEKMELKI